MYQTRGARKGQRFSMTHASRENRFAAVKAALRKQSLTFEPYSEEVIHALWDELQERHGSGVYCMLRKGLQNALLARLAQPLDDGRMSKNKVNKIFQVLIRSCFVLHSRGGAQGEDGESELMRDQPPPEAFSGGEPATVHGPVALGSIGSSDCRSSRDGGDGLGDSATTSIRRYLSVTPTPRSGKIDGSGDSAKFASASTQSTSVCGMETPGPTRPFSLNMDWPTPSVDVAGPRQDRAVGALGNGRGTSASRLEGPAPQKTPSPCTTVSWPGYPWTGNSCPSNDKVGGGGGDSDLSLTPEESSVFSRTGILPSSTLPTSSSAAAADTGGGGGGGDRSCVGGDSGSGGGSGTFAYADRDVLRRLSLSPASAKKDLRRSVSSEDLLAGLRIRMDRDGLEGEAGSPLGPHSLSLGEDPRITLTEQGAATPVPDVDAYQGDRVKGERAPSFAFGGGGESQVVGGVNVTGACATSACDEDESESAGAVCELREDVGSLEEVILTHNAFIRKVAVEAGIRLPAGEWAAFFGYDQPVSAELEAARSRPTPSLPPPQADPLGHMNKEQLYKFRTAWCSRSHPHVEEFCEHAHEEVNRGWLRRDPTKHPYLPRRCSRVILPAPGGDFVDDCPRGRSCPASHSLEEIQYHPQSYKTQVCPHGGKCRSKAFCPHAHVLESGVAGAMARGVRRTRSAGGLGVAGDTEALSSGLGLLRRGSSGASCRPVSPCEGGVTKRGEEEWQTVGRRGRRAPSPAESEGQTWVPPARVRSRSWSGSECWSPGVDGGSSREFRRRATGVTGLLAALRKRSADVMQPPSKHEELLRTIYSTLRRREPNGCDEKELVGRVFHTSSSSSVDKSGRGDAKAPVSGAGVGGGRGGGGGVGGAEAGGAAHSGDTAVSDSSNSHPFSKTKVRGAVTLLKFAQAVRVGRGETAGQHVLYVAHELATLSDFITRHNRHLVEMARELGVDMTPQDWKSLLESDHTGGRPLPSPSPTNQSESSASTGSPAPADAPRSAWSSDSPTGALRRPSPCPKPPQHQRFPGVPLPSPPPRHGTPQSPMRTQGTRSNTVSPLVQKPVGGENQVMHRAASDRAIAIREHALWHGGQLLQFPPPPPPPLQHQQQSQQSQMQPPQQVGRFAPPHSPQATPPQSPSLSAVGGAWGQVGPGGLAQRLQGAATTGCPPSMPPPQPPPAQAQHHQAGALTQQQPFQGGGVGTNMSVGALKLPPPCVQPVPAYGMPPPAPPPPPPLLGSRDGSPFGGGSPLSYGQGDGGSTSSEGGGASGFLQQQSQVFSVLPAGGNGSARSQGGGGGHTFGVGVGVRNGGGGRQSQGQAAFLRAANAGMSWRFGAEHAGSSGDRSEHRRDVTSGVLRHAVETSKLVVPTPRNPLHLQQQQHSIRHHQASPPTVRPQPPPQNQLPTVSVSERRPSNHSPGSGRASGLRARSSLTGELHRQSSLPPGPQSVLVPARMAQTPPAAVSRLGFTGGSRGGVSGHAKDDDAPITAAALAAAAAVAAAAATAAVTEGATEIWEREQARLSVGGRGSSPAESRIAAVAIAAKNKAAAEAASATVVGAASSAESEHSRPRKSAARFPADAEERHGASLSGRVNRGSSADIGGGMVDGDQASMEGMSLVGEDGGRDGGALPGLSDLTCSGRRYNLF